MSTENAGTGTPRRVHVEGELTIYRVAELRVALIQALEDGTDVEMDLSQVTEMDGPGLQLVVATRRLASAEQRGFSVVAMSAAAARVFRLAGLDDAFGVAAQAS
jgi:anti-sigma B factor antagonist